MRYFFLAMTLFSFNLAFTNSKVAVIGAGVAGLTTAYRLKQAGFEVDVYEARSRVGGRILTVSVAGQFSELGAHNIADGGDAEHLSKLIKEVGLELIDHQVAHSERNYWTGKKMVPEKELLGSYLWDPEQLKVRLDELAKNCSTMREVLNNFFAKDDPIHKFLAARLAAYEGGSVDQLSSTYITTLYHIMLGGLCVAHPYNAQEEKSFHYLQIQGGNALLPEALAANLKGSINLDYPLKALSKKDDNYLLTFKEGKQTLAKYVVLACPCSVFEDIEFEEGLIPKEKLHAIKKIPYGTNAKILIPCLSTSSQRISMTHDHWVSFLGGEKNLLILYFMGKPSKFTQKTISKNYLKQLSCLKKGYPQLQWPTYLPVMAEDISFKNYEGPVGYSWPNDPFVKGSYTYLAAGQEEVFTRLENIEGVQVKSLFAPLHHSLFFAGEHASILFEVAGTLEAACESGERTAQLIHEVEKWQ